MKAGGDDNSFQLFVQIADNTDFATVDRRIIKAKYNNLPQEDKKFNAEIILHPMRNWRLRSDWENGQNTGGLIDYVWLFGFVGGFCVAAGLHQLHEPEYGPLRKTGERSRHPQGGWLPENSINQPIFQ